jgi:hypothetical protein
MFLVENYSDTEVRKRDGGVEESLLLVRQKRKAKKKE